MINEVEINTTDKRWLHEMLLTLEQTYKKTKYFDRYFHGLWKILTGQYELIEEMDIELA